MLMNPGKKFALKLLTISALFILLTGCSPAMLRSVGLGGPSVIAKQFSARYECALDDVNEVKVTDEGTIMVTCKTNTAVMFCSAIRVGDGNRVAYSCDMPTGGIASRSR